MILGLALLRIQFLAIHFEKPLNFPILCLAYVNKLFFAGFLSQFVVTPERLIMDCGGDFITEHIPRQLIGVKLWVRGRKESAETLAKENKDHDS